MDSLDQFRGAVKHVFEQCGSLEFQAAGVAECVDTIGELKELRLAVDGLVIALMGHVDSVQAEARERAAQAAGGGGTDEASGPKAALLPGRDATMSELMARTGKKSKRGAANEVRAAQMANESFPRFVDLMRRGKISEDHIEILRSAAKSPGLTEAIRSDEDKILTLAEEQSVDEFRTSIRALLFKHAPAFAEREVRAAERHEKLTLYPDANGYRVHGWFTALNGAVLNNAIRQQVGVPARGDRRDQSERNAEALVQIAHLVQEANEYSAGGANGSSDGSIGAGLSDGPAAGLGGYPGNRRSSVRKSGTPVRHQVLVHVPLSTLIRTEEAIEAGCGVISSGLTDVGGMDSPAGGVGRVGVCNTSASDSDKGRQNGTDNSPSAGGSEVGNSKAGGSRLDSGSGDSRWDSGGSTSGSKRRRPTRAPDLFDSCGPPPEWAVAEVSGSGPPDDSGGEASRSGPPDDTGSLDSGFQRGHSRSPGTFGRAQRVRDSREVGLDCPTDGVGLGRRGACLESREELQHDLGTMLGMIQAGIDISMLDGFAPARLSDGSPLAPTQLAQMLCDSDLARIVMTAHGEPIDASRNQRLYGARQTKAVIARDMHCRFPGCTRGPEVGQVHHAQEWEKGGATVIDNAVLLCFAHHRYVHAKQITIAHHAGGFLFTERDGSVVGITRHAKLLAA